MFVHYFDFMLLFYLFTFDLVSCPPIFRLDDGDMNRMYLSETLMHLNGNRNIALDFFTRSHIVENRQLNDILKLPDDLSITYQECPTTEDCTPAKHYPCSDPTKVCVHTCIPGGRTTVTATARVSTSTAESSRTSSEPTEKLSEPTKKLTEPTKKLGEPTKKLDEPTKTSNETPPKQPTAQTNHVIASSSTTIQNTRKSSTNVREKPPKVTTMPLTITQCIKYKFTTAMAKNRFRAAECASTVETADGDATANGSSHSSEEYEDRR